MNSQFNALMKSEKKHIKGKNVRAAEAKKTIQAAKIRGCIGGALIAVAGTFGSPAFAQDGQCGLHSVDALFQDALGAQRVQLIDGIVFGVPIADVVADFNLYRVGNEIGLIISGGGMEGSAEFELDKVALGDALDFSGAGFGITLPDLGSFSGCPDISNFPQYVGTGHMISADGQSMPATARLFMWLGFENIEGASELRTTLYAVGVIRSQVLNGKFFVM